MTPTASKITGNYFHASTILMSCQNFAIYFNIINPQNGSGSHFPLFGIDVTLLSTYLVLIWHLLLIKTFIKSNIGCHKELFLTKDLLQFLNYMETEYVHTFLTYFYFSSTYLYC